MLVGDEHILKLYGSDDSYFWRNRKELLEMCDVIKEKDMFIDCDLLNQFRQWQSERNIVKESPEQLAHLMDYNETIRMEEGKAADGGMPNVK